MFITKCVSEESYYLFKANIKTKDSLMNRHDYDSLFFLHVQIKFKSNVKIIKFRSLNFISKKKQTNALYISRN